MVLPHEYTDMLKRYYELQEIKTTRFLTDEEDEEYEDLYIEILEQADKQWQKD